jgi:cardiolipin synthase
MDPAVFRESLRHAFVDARRRLDRVSLAVTGLGWLGAGIPAVEQEMAALIRSAERDISLCCYSITSGAISLLRDMREVAAQGANVTFIVNDFEQQPATIRRFLQSGVRELHDRWRVFDFGQQGIRGDLHAKVLTVDRSVALIGSANLSFHGMVANHEMAIVLRGPTAEVIAERVDMLSRSAAVRRVS